MREDLKRRAGAQGVSVNRLVVAALAAFLAVPQAADRGRPS